MIGINRLTLRKIGAGTANPQLNIVMRIAGGLNVSLSALFAEAEALARELEESEG